MTIVYRADGRAPEDIKNYKKIKGGGFEAYHPIGLGVKKPKTIIDVVLEEAQKYINDPSILEQHVRSNPGTLVSTGADEDCGGYAANAKFVYKIDIPALVLFEQSNAKFEEKTGLKPKPAGKPAPPKLYVDATLPKKPTIVALSAGKKYIELSFFTAIEYKYIKQFKPKGGEWTDMP